MKRYVLRSVWGGPHIHRLRARAAASSPGTDMTNAQVWTIIGLSIAFLVILATIVTLVLRLIDVRIKRLQAELVARLNPIEARLDALQHELQRRHRPPAA
jgi:hypothetical protein